MIGKRFSIFPLALLLPLFACSGRPQIPQLPKPKPKPVPTQPSIIRVEVHSGGPAVVTTSTAEFQLRADGYVQAFLLLKDGRKLSLDEPRLGALTDSDYAVIGGKEVHFTLDFAQAQVLETFGKMGAGKRLEISARPLGPSGTELQRILAFEAYDRYPNVLFASVEYKNTGTTRMRIDKIMDQRHRLNAKLADGKAQSWEVRSYHSTGSSMGKGEVVRLQRTFSRGNALEPRAGAGDRDFAVVAFWTDELGEAIGYLDNVSKPAAIPVKVASDGRISVQFEMATDTMLMPGESYSGPRNFLAVYGGDGAQPLRLWSALPQREGAEPRPASALTKP